MAARLDFEERKFNLKCYWKYENAVEVQRQFRREFNKEPPTRVTITRIRDKFEADGTVQDVHKKRSGRPRTLTSPRKEERVLETFEMIEPFHDVCHSIASRCQQCLEQNRQQFENMR